jgi:hypothetical protein
MGLLALVASDWIQLMIAIPAVALFLWAIAVPIWKKVSKILHAIEIVVKEVTPNGGNSMKDQLARNTNITRKIRRLQAVQHLENSRRIGDLEKGQKIIIEEQERVRKELNEMKNTCPCGPKERRNGD